MILGVRKKLIHVLTLTSGVGALAISVILALELGFKLSAQNKALFSTLHSALFVYLLADIFLRFFFQGHIRYLFTHPTDLFAVFPLLQPVLPQWDIETMFLLAQIALLLILLGRLMHIHYLFKFLKLKPAQMLLMGFIFAIFIGSLLLSLPIATTTQHIPYVDALFTATSAICVTGLTVVDTGSVFTFFGQIVVLVLIQIGGLGIMTLSALLTMLLHRKISRQDTVEFQSSYDTDTLSQTFHTIRSIFIFTFIIEFIGTGLLFLFWHQRFASWTAAAYSSIFHAISAFCNAGFSLYPNNFCSYATQAPVILTVSFLIIIGGIGFPVIINLWQRLIHRNGFNRIRMNTKLTLWITLSLLIFGTLIILLTEYQHALAAYSPLDKLLISFFHSVSARTCGFNSIDLNQCYNATLFIMIILMYIGASPGSTGGGIKTTTFGVLLTVVLNTLRARDRVVFFGRTIGQNSIRKVLAVVILSAFFIILTVYGILLTDSFPFFKILFETVSAFGTVGLSLGITRYLSILGKLFIIILMYVGRVGPLTIAFALSRQRPQPNMTYPEGNVLIG